MFNFILKSKQENRKTVTFCCCCCLVLSCFCFSTCLQCFVIITTVLLCQQIRIFFGQLWYAFPPSTINEIISCFYIINHIPAPSGADKIVSWAQTLVRLLFHSRMPMRHQFLSWRLATLNKAPLIYSTRYLNFLHVPVKHRHWY